VVKETDKIKLLQNNQPSSRHIIFGLLQAAAMFCHYHQVRNWYFLTTRPLEKVLRKGGLNLSKIGGRCDHRGERYPYKMDVGETYFSKSWGNDYKNGYRLFSQHDAARLPKTSHTDWVKIDQRKANHETPYDRRRTNSLTTRIIPAFSALGCWRA
jgi:hypothetical protein